jgi:hypothetical protein
MQPIKMTTQHAPRRAYLFSFGEQKVIAQGKFCFFGFYVPTKFLVIFPISVPQVLNV